MAAANPAMTRAANRAGMNVEPTGEIADADWRAGHVKVRHRRILPEGVIPRVRRVSMTLSGR